MDTAEELGAAFGLDVTDEAFWTASLDVIRARIADYERLAAERRVTSMTVSDVSLPTAAPTASGPTRYGATRDELADLLADEPRVPRRPGVGRAVPRPARRRRR